MNQTRFRAGALLGAIAVVLTGATAALADIPAVFRDAQNNIYVTGQSPSARVSMTYKGLMKSRDYQANSCGWILLRSSTTTPIPASVTVAGTTINTSSLPTQLMPSCNNGVAEETRTANFKTNEGTVVIVGRAPSSYVTVQTPQDKARSATANACGVAKFSNSTTYQHTNMTQIDLEDAPIANYISDLTQKDGILCSRGSLYVPASWLSDGGGS